MALPENRIGDHQFLVLSGDRAPPKQILSLDERPGVDGTEITQEGLKGHPFTMRSEVDQENLDTASTTYLEYVDLIEADPVELIQDDQSSVAEGFRVQVLDVRRVLAKKIVPGPGGLNAPSLAYLICDWDLIAIPE